MAVSGHQTGSAAALQNSDWHMTSLLFGFLRRRSFELADAGSIDQRCDEPAPRGRIRRLRLDRSPLVGGPVKYQTQQL